MAQSKHRDIFDTLKADILGGKYEDGKPLPSAFALMKKFGVIVPEARTPFYTRVCEGIANFANNRGGGH